MMKKRSASRNSKASQERSLDGRRLQLHELRLPEKDGRSRLSRALRALSEFLAGMYTGESCAGTPHESRSPHRAGKQAEPPATKREPDS